MINTDAAMAYVRQKATEMMNETCVIERVRPPSFDQLTGTGVPGSRTTIYSGPCRLWEVASGGPVLINEDEVLMQNTQLSIPWDIETLPKRKDEIEIIGSRSDDLVVGKRFVIESSAKAGELRSTRRFAVSSVN